MLNPVVGRCQHDALLYASDTELIETIVPFVYAGLSAGDVILVYGDGLQLTVLREALGDDPAIQFADADGLHQNLAATLQSYQQMFDHDTGTVPRGIRSTGPAPLDDDPAANADWIRYEALVNHVLAPYPFQAICTYDTRTQPADRVASARRTHPHVRWAGSRVCSPGYLEPAEVLLQIGPATPPPVEATAPALQIEDGRDLAAVRHELYLAVHDSGLPAESADDFLAAVNEVLVNALQHGQDPVTVRLWCRSDRVHCAVSDAGGGISDPLAGYTSPHSVTEPGGIGLWMARQLCDQLAIGPAFDGGGCTVRLSSAC